MLTPEVTFCPWLTEFVVVAPNYTEVSKMNFYADGFWFNLVFSPSTQCAKVQVWAPTRAAVRAKRKEEEVALEPFLHGTSCVGGEKSFFRL